MKLSAKLKALDTLSLKSMASGLRCLKKGQKSLLKAIEAEIKEREEREKAGKQISKK